MSRDAFDAMLDERMRQMFEARAVRPVLPREGELLDRMRACGESLKEAATELLDLRAHLAGDDLPDRHQIMSVFVAGAQLSAAAEVRLEGRPR